MPPMVALIDGGLEQTDGQAELECAQPDGLLPERLSPQHTPLRLVIRSRRAQRLGGLNGSVGVDGVSDELWVAWV